VTPRTTVFLDAVEGGRVEQVLVEDGATVRKGDLIAVLSNTSLQLQVTQSQALAAEQLNNMRTLELQLEQNRLQHKSALAEIDYQIKHLTRELLRQRHLAATSAARQSELQDVEDQLEYNQHRRELTLESQAADARMQETQLTYLHTTTSQLEESVAIGRNNLEGLKVHAPINGKLSGFDIDIGQSIAPGGRLGQIDDPEDFKLTASVDEYYLGRVDLEQKAEFEQGAGTASLRVAKTYPQVKNGQFDIDLKTDYSWQAKQQDSIGQTPDTIQPAYGIWNGQIALTDRKNDWNARLIFKNIANQHYYLIEAEGNGGLIGSVPRDFSRYAGVSLHKDF